MKIGAIPNVESENPRMWSSGNPECGLRKAPKVIGKPRRPECGVRECPECGVREAPKVDRENPNVDLESPN